MVVDVAVAVMGAGVEEVVDMAEADTKPRSQSTSKHLNLFVLYLDKISNFIVIMSLNIN